MYKLLLCWRYLLTRYLALACIVSVMLGVATLIVVNSVMSGFSTKLKERLWGLLSDIVIETPNLSGFPLTDDEMLERIRNSPAGNVVGGTVGDARPHQRQTDTEVDGMFATQELQRDVSLVMVHGDHAVELALAGAHEQRVGRPGTGNVESLLPGTNHGRLDNPGFLITE